MMRLTRSVLTFLSIMVLLPCCRKEEGPVVKEDKIVLSSIEAPEMHFPADGGNADLKFGAYGSDWTISSSKDWVSANPTSGTSGTRTVKISAEKNPTLDDRDAVLTIVCGKEKLDIAVLQPGNPSAEHLYKVIAHRGGYLENGLPEGSVAALKKTISQYCYGSECDAMWTMDNDIILCHPDGNNMVNGLVPSTHTLAEIQAAGGLSNGEKLPSLRDYLAVLTDKSINPHGTRLWIDVKGPSADLQEKVMVRCAEIAKEYNACSLVEFLVPNGYSAYTAMKAQMGTNYGINCAWNGHIGDPSIYGDGGWAQLPYSDYKASKYWPPTTLMDAGVTLSIYYTPSKVSSCKNFYNDVFPYYSRMKAIFVNFPEDTINNLISKGYETRVVK